MGPERITPRSHKASSCRSHHCRRGCRTAHTRRYRVLLPAQQENPQIPCWIHELAEFIPAVARSGASVLRHEPRRWIWRTSATTWELQQSLGLTLLIASRMLPPHTQRNLVLDWFFSFPFSYLLKDFVYYFVGRNRDQGYVVNCVVPRWKRTQLLID